MTTSSSFPSLKVLLGASLALHLSVFILWLSSSSSPSSSSSSSISTTLTWTLPAALQAQIAAAHNCSGHGYVPVELIRLEDSRATIACHCDECFTGASCEHIIPDCRLDIDGGDPLIFGSYWRANAEASAVLIPGWYRIGYEFYHPLIPAFEEEIRALHSFVGNAITEGRYILIGTGATQLLLAAFLSLSLDAQGLPVSTIVPAPYYETYKRQVDALQPGGAKWAEFTESFILEEAANDRFSIEVITSPNNPDGSLRESVLSGNGSRSVYDLAYYWPHYTAISGPLDQDLMIFTLSKITGHAGSRIGWAIIKDYDLYTRMLLYIRLNCIGIAHESQLRAAHLLRAARDGYAKSGNPSLEMLPADYAARHLLFHYGHKKLWSRWDVLRQVLKGSDRFSIQQDFEPKYCNFFKDVVQPAPAFAWIRCEREDEQDCPALFETAGIIGRGGTRCGADDRYVRLAMMNTDFAFENVISRIQTLVSKQ